MHELGYNNVLKFEDGFSTHWRQWLIPANDKIFYNTRIFESDEKSRTKWIYYYEKFAIVLFPSLLEENISKEQYQILINKLYETSNTEELIVTFSNFVLLAPT